jgi:hypothetical protein
LEPHPELLAESVSQTQRCYDGSTSLAECTFGSPKVGTLMLVGDSHADTISDAVVEAAVDEGYEVVIRTHLACPLITVPLAFEPECVTRQGETLELIREIEPAMVVIANNSPLALTNLGLASDSTTISPEALSSWEAALRGTFADIEPFVDRVVLFSVIPTFRSDEFDRALPTLLRPHGAYPTASVDSIQSWRGPILAAEARAAADAGGFVELVDPLPYLCPNEACAIRSADGTFRYRDGAHLSNPIARGLAEPLRSSLRSAAYGRQRPRSHRSRSYDWA